MGRVIRVLVLLGWMSAEGLGCGRRWVRSWVTSGNRDYQRASRSALKDFTDEALTMSAPRF